MGLIAIISDLCAQDYTGIVLIIHEIEGFSFPLLNCVGKLDVWSLAGLLRALRRVRRASPRCLCLDLAEVTDATQAAVALLQVSPLMRAVRLVGASPAVVSAIRALELTQIIALAGAVATLKA